MHNYLTASVFFWWTITLTKIYWRTFLTFERLNFCPTHFNWESSYFWGFLDIQLLITAKYTKQHGENTCKVFNHYFGEKCIKIILQLQVLNVYFWWKVFGQCNTHTYQNLRLIHTSFFKWSQLLLCSESCLKNVNYFT